MILYFLILRIAALFNAKARKLVRGQAQTISLLREKRKEGERWVWFHAASAGEFEQARVLMERMRADKPSLKILLTFFSPSGYELRKDYAGADMVAYLPFATRRNARRFLEVLKPETAVFIKYEYWPAYLKALHKNSIPTYIICAIFRPKDTFFRWWGAPYRRLLRYFTRLFVQDEQSAELLQKYHIDNVMVAGDTRFDRVCQIARQHQADSVVERFTQYSRQIIVAGSTWLPDERLLARYLAPLCDVIYVGSPEMIYPTI